MLSLTWFYFGLPLCLAFQYRLGWRRAHFHTIHEIPRDHRQIHSRLQYDFMLISLSVPAWYRSWGVEMHSAWQIIIPVIAVYGQLVIFHYHLLRDEHYGNYLWSIALMLGTVSVGILTNSEKWRGSHGSVKIFKPWVIRKDEPERVVSEATDSIKCDV